MDSEKRNIIVNEIMKWRNSKLLPEQYCNFLLNLYQDDEGHHEQSGSSTARKTFKLSNWKIWLTLLVFSTAACLVVIYFNSFPILLQIAISVLFVLIWYLLGYAKRTSSPIVSYVCFGAGCISLLLLGVYWIEVNDSQQLFWVPVYLLLCSLVWIAVGITAEIALFHFCGWIGLFLAYGWFLFSRLDELHWLTLQVCWLPFSFIFIGIAWLLRSENKSITNVLFMVGLILWFVPEAYGVSLGKYWAGEADRELLLKFSFMGKIAIAGVGLLLLRKKWTKWVASWLNFHKG